MRSDTILHLQKVAGISGSEAHLLSLLPRLRERGWDVRMVMLHENEPGAWDFAKAPARTRRAAGCDPASRRLRSGRVRQACCVPHAHATCDSAYASRPCRRLRATRRHRWRASRCASRRSTGSTSFAKRRTSVLPTAPFASLAHVHIAISRGLARYLEDVEGFDDESFEIVHYGIDPNGEPAPYAEDGAAPALCRAFDPDQRPHRSAAGVRRGAADSCRVSSSRSQAAVRSSRRSRRSRASLASAIPFASSGKCRRSRLRSNAPQSSSSLPWARASAWSRSRRWSARDR